MVAQEAIAEVLEVQPDGSRLSVGTAFAISRDFALTAFHVVGDRQTGVAGTKPIVLRFLRFREDRLTEPYECGASYREVDSRLDAAILRLKSSCRMREKGGKEKELPVHHKLEELLDQYLGHKPNLKERAVHQLREFLAMFIYLWVLLALFVINQSAVLAREHHNYQAHFFAFREISRVIGPGELWSLLLSRGTRLYTLQSRPQQ